MYAALENTRALPSMDKWLCEAKLDADACKVGMYLTHNGTVRSTARAKVRDGDENAGPVAGMAFAYDEKKAAEAVLQAGQMAGIYYVRAWLNSGTLAAGEDIMYVLVGGDIRPHTIDALQFLVGKLKAECVSETELE